MKFICKTFCVLALIALLQAIPAQGAGKDGAHPGRKSPVKSEEMSGFTLKIAGGEVQGGSKVVRVKQGDKVKLNLWPIEPPKSISTATTSKKSYLRAEWP